MLQLNTCARSKFAAGLRNPSRWCGNIRAVLRVKRSAIRAAIVITAIAALVVLAAAVAFAQSPSASAAASGAAKAVPASEPGPPIPYYFSYALMGLAGVTILAVLAGYLFQAPGFRRSSRGSE